MTITGRGGVPVEGASAVVLNVTAAAGTAPGFVTVWPTGLPRPNASTLNVTFVGHDIPNQVIVPLGTDGRISIYTLSGTHLIADVLGWFTGGLQAISRSGLFQPLPTGAGARHAFQNPPGTSLVAPPASLDLAIVGRAGVPTFGAESVVLNVTAPNRPDPASSPCGRPTLRGPWRPTST